MKVRPLIGILLLTLFTGAALAEGPRVYTFAGSNWKFPTDSVMAADAPLGKPAALAVDRDNNVYVADKENNIIARISPQGVLTVVAGNGSNNSSGDG